MSTLAPAAPRRHAALEPATPRERLELLCDPGSFQSLRSAVASRSGRGGHEGDGVLVGAGTVGGRPVYCYAQDPSFMGGSLGEAHADSIVGLMELAGRAGAPIVGFVESGGARLQEGHQALAGYGRIFRASVQLSRRVPQIAIVTGVSAGGGAYSPALADFVVMTERARMFLTGPKIVTEALGESVSMEELGGHRVHEHNGVCDMVVPDDAAAAAAARDLLAHLPQSIGGPRSEIAEPLPPRSGDPGAAVPEEGRKVYDVRDVVRGVVDASHLVEVWPRWGQSMLTAFARIDGRPVGVIANQPRYLGGVIDAVAAEKGALFVNTCARFELPLVVLVDTPGFMPGTRQEGAGVIRHGAALLRAFAGADVPRITVVLRKAYGGAAITMNSKDLGGDMVFAWPQAEVGIMAARQAVGIVRRREIDAADEPEAARDEMAAEYAGEHLTADAAAGAGFVDEVIAPADTRRRLVWGLRALEGR